MNVWFVISDSTYIRMPLQPASSLTKIIISTGLAAENTTVLEVCNDNDGTQHKVNFF
jgi:hypothetical protein